MRSVSVGRQRNYQVADADIDLYGPDDETICQRGTRSRLDDASKCNPVVLSAAVTVADDPGAGALARRQRPVHGMKAWCDQAGL
jgi:hypothetical protein